MRTGNKIMIAAVSAVVAVSVCTSIYTANKINKEYSKKPNRIYSDTSAVTAVPETIYVEIPGIPPVTHTENIQTQLFSEPERTQPFVSSEEKLNIRSAKTESITEKTTASITVPTTENISLQALNMLNKSVNKTKNYRGVQKFHHIENLSAEFKKCTGGEIAVSIANKITEKIITPTDEILNFSNGYAENSKQEKISALLPINKPFSLEEKDITNISTSEENGLSVVTVQIPSEKVENNGIPAINAKSIGYIDFEDIDTGVAEITSVSVLYKGSTVKAYISEDGFTEKILYTVPVYIELEAKIGHMEGFAVIEGLQSELWERVK